MNWFDGLLILLLVLSVCSAFRKGLTREVVGLISVVVALLLGAWFYGTAGAFLRPYVSSPGTANFCGFVIVFLGVIVAGGIAGLALARLLRITGLSFMDRVLGAGFGVVRGVLIAVALVMAMMAFAPGAQPPRAVVQSRLAPYMVDAARMVSTMAPHELKDGFRRSYQQIKGAWGNALKRGIRTLPRPETIQKNAREI